MGIYDLQFVGPSAESALKVFVNDLSNSNKGIDLTICILLLCYHDCRKLNIISEQEAIDKNQNEENYLVFIILLVMANIFAITSLLLCLALCCLRHVATS